MSSNTTTYTIPHVPQGQLAQTVLTLQHDPRYVSHTVAAEDPPQNTLWTIVAVMKAAV